MYLKSLFPAFLSYISVGKEVAPSTGTPHLQFYIETKVRRTWGKMVKILHKKTNIQPSVGSAEANNVYTQKGANYEVFGQCHEDVQKEAAVKGSEVTKDKWAEIRTFVKAGNLEALEERHYEECLRFNLRAKLEFPVPELVGGPNYWIWGPPGTGKSSVAKKYAEEQGLAIFAKTPTKWWDNYLGEPVVVIDDLDRESIGLLNMVKILGDHFPFQAEVKGGQKKIRPEVVFITSNSSPQAVFPNASKDDILAIERRYEVLHFGRQVKYPTSLPERREEPEFFKHLKDYHQGLRGDPGWGQDSLYGTLLKV